jgi:hypothetical protein
VGDVAGTRGDDECRPRSVSEQEISERQADKTKLLELLAECAARLDANENEAYGLWGPAQEIAKLSGFLGIPTPPIEFAVLHRPFHKLHAEHSHLLTVNCLIVHDPYGPIIAELVLGVTAATNYDGPDIILPSPTPARATIRRLIDSWRRKIECIDVRTIVYRKPPKRVLQSLEQYVHAAAFIRAMKGPMTPAEQREADEFAEYLQNPEARQTLQEWRNGPAQFKTVGSIFPKSESTSDSTSSRSAPTEEQIADAIEQHASHRATLAQIEHEILEDLRQSPGRVAYIELHTRRILRDRFDDDPAKHDLARAAATREARALPRHGGQTERHFRHKTTLKHPPNTGLWWNPKEVQDVLRDLRDRGVIEWVPADKAGEFSLLDDEEHREPVWRLCRQGRNADREPPSESSHSPDFTSVNWCGLRFEFAKGHQALAIGALWQAWESGEHSLTVETIAEKCGTSSNRFQLGKVFRSKKQDGGYEPHPAWGTLIIEAGKGCYRLNPALSR